MADPEDGAREARRRLLDPAIARLQKNKNTRSDGDRLAVAVDLLRRIGQRPDVLYIGASWRGVERPLGAGHEKLRECAPGDRVVIWACPASDLWQLEEGLIRRYRPRYNKPNGGTPCPDCGGRWKLLEHPAGRCDLCQRRRANGYSTDPG